MASVPKHPLCPLEATTEQLATCALRSAGAVGTTPQAPVSGRSSPRSIGADCVWERTKPQKVGLRCGGCVLGTPCWKAAELAWNAGAAMAHATYDVRAAVAAATCMACFRSSLTTVAQCSSTDWAAPDWPAAVSGPFFGAICLQRCGKGVNEIVGT